MLLGASASASTNAGSKSRSNWRANASARAAYCRHCVGLQAADLVEEPAAGGEHEHGVSLHLQEPQCVGGLNVVQVGVAVLGQELGQGRADYCGRRMTSMKASRATQGLGKHSRPRVLKR